EYEERDQGGGDDPPDDGGQACEKARDRLEPVGDPIQRTAQRARRRPRLEPPVGKDVLRLAARGVGIDGGEPVRDHTATLGSLRCMSSCTSNASFLMRKSK